MLTILSRGAPRLTSSVLRCSSRTSAALAPSVWGSIRPGRSFHASRASLIQVSRPTQDAEKSTPKHTVIDGSSVEEHGVYQGPLSNTFRRLKLFSLGSFGLSAVLAPFLFIIESNLPTSARFALVGIALGTSGLSTSLVAWCAKPYVLMMRRIYPQGPGAAEELELTTMTLFLKQRITKVYDPSFLIETRRPMAQWELAQDISLTNSRVKEVGTNVHPEAGAEETVAETFDQNGEVVGRWVVKWEGNGQGKCHQTGEVVRYFNVHEELLK